LAKGESVAVNGVCLTLERELAGGVMEFHVLAETLGRSNLGGLPPGSLVNLERAMTMGGRLGGHLVTGHIDATAAVRAVRRNRDDLELEVETPAVVAPHLVEKGSIAIDGVSLTLAGIGGGVFSVRLIPVTWEATALPRRRPGALVNLEADLIGKHVRRQLMGAAATAGINAETLRLAGWEI
jgi:riboflavin synthase